MKYADLTIIIPAYNEANSIRDTIKSIKAQSLLPKKIVVVDDCSTDDTAKVAISCGVKVLQPPVNTGSKAGAQNYALQFIDTKYTMALDADTTLEKDAIEKLMEAFTEKKVVAACGYVIPRYVRTVWERGRYIEYLLAFTFFKPIQDYFGKPFISSGCFSLYKTKILKELSGWPTRTMAEDMDLTWTFYEKGYGVKFIPQAVCYPIEPHNYHFMSKQLKRWSHGFVQNIILHWRSVLPITYLNSMIAVASWDAIIASFVYTIIFPFLTIIFHNPLILLGYIIDAPIVFIPVIFMGIIRKEVRRVLVSFPSFFVLRTVNGIFMLEAIWSELIQQKRLAVYEKGH